MCSSRRVPPQWSTSPAIKIDNARGTGPHAYGAKSFQAVCDALFPRHAGSISSQLDKKVTQRQPSVTHLHSGRSTRSKYNVCIPAGPCQARGKINRQRCQVPQIGFFLKRLSGSAAPLAAHR